MEPTTPIEATVYPNFFVEQKEKNTKKSEKEEYKHKLPESYFNKDKKKDELNVKEGNDKNSINQRYLEHFQQIISENATDEQKIKIDHCIERAKKSSFEEQRKELFENKEGWLAFGSEQAPLWVHIDIREAKITLCENNPMLQKIFTKIEKDQTGKVVTKQVALGYRCYKADNKRFDNASFPLDNLKDLDAETAQKTLKKFFNANKEVTLPPPDEAPEYYHEFSSSIMPNGLDLGVNFALDLTIHLSERKQETLALERLLISLRHRDPKLNLAKTAERFAFLEQFDRVIEKLKQAELPDEEVEEDFLINQPLMDEAQNLIKKGSQLNKAGVLTQRDLKAIVSLHRYLDSCVVQKEQEPQLFKPKLFDANSFTAAAAPLGHHLQEVEEQALQAAEAEPPINLPTSQHVREAAPLDEVTDVEEQKQKAISEAESDPKKLLEQLRELSKEKVELNGSRFSRKRSQKTQYCQKVCQLLPLPDAVCWQRLSELNREELIEAIELLNVIQDQIIIDCDIESNYFEEIKIDSDKNKTIIVEYWLDEFSVPVTDLLQGEALEKKDFSNCYAVTHLSLALLGHASYAVCKQLGAKTPQNWNLQPFMARMKEGVLFYDDRDRLKAEKLFVIGLIQHPMGKATPHQAFVNRLTEGELEASTSMFEDKDNWSGWRDLLIDEIIEAIDHPKEGQKIDKQELIEIWRNFQKLDLLYAVTGDKLNTESMLNDIRSAEETSPEAELRACLHKADIDLNDYPIEKSRIRVDQFHKDIVQRLKGEDFNRFILLYHNIRKKDASYKKNNKSINIEKLNKEPTTRQLAELYSMTTKKKESLIENGVYVQKALFLNCYNASTFCCEKSGCLAGSPLESPLKFSSEAMFQTIDTFVDFYILLKNDFSPSSNWEINTINDSAIEDSILDMSRKPPLRGLFSSHEYPRGGCNPSDVNRVVNKTKLRHCKVFKQARVGLYREALELSCNPYDIVSATVGFINNHPEALADEGITFVLQKNFMTLFCFDRLFEVNPKLAKELLPQQFQKAISKLERQLNAPGMTDAKREEALLALSNLLFLAQRFKQGVEKAAEKRGETAQEWVKGHLDYRKEFERLLGPQNKMAVDMRSRISDEQAKAIGNRFKETWPDHNSKQSWECEAFYLHQFVSYIEIKKMSQKAQNSYLKERCIRFCRRLHSDLPEETQKKTRIDLLERAEFDVEYDRENQLLKVIFQKKTFQPSTTTIEIKVDFKSSDYTYGGIEDASFFTFKSDKLSYKESLHRFVDEIKKLTSESVDTKKPLLESIPFQKTFEYLIGKPPKAALLTMINSTPVTFQIGQGPYSCNHQGEFFREYSVDGKSYQLLYTPFDKADDSIKLFAHRMGFTPQRELLFKAPNGNLLVWSKAKSYKTDGPLFFIYPTSAFAERLSDGAFTPLDRPFGAQTALLGKDRIAWYTKAVDPDTGQQQLIISSIEDKQIEQEFAVETSEEGVKLKSLENKGYYELDPYSTPLVCSGVDLSKLISHSQVKLLGNQGGGRLIYLPVKAKEGQPSFVELSVEEGKLNAKDPWALLLGLLTIGLDKSPALALETLQKIKLEGVNSPHQAAALELLQDFLMDSKFADPRLVMEAVVIGYSTAGKPFFTGISAEERSHQLLPALQEISDSCFIGLTETYIQYQSAIASSLYETLPENLERKFLIALEREFKRRDSPHRTEKVDTAKKDETKASFTKDLKNIKAFGKKSGSSVSLAIDFLKKIFMPDEIHQAYRNRFALFARPRLQQLQGHKLSLSDSWQKKISSLSLGSQLIHLFGEVPFLEAEDKPLDGFLSNVSFFINSLPLNTQALSSAQIADKLYNQLSSKLDRKEDLPDFKDAKKKFDEVKDKNIKERNQFISDHLLAFYTLAINPHLTNPERQELIFFLDLSPPDHQMHDFCKWLSEVAKTPKAYPSIASLQSKRERYIIKNKALKEKKEGLEKKKKDELNNIKTNEESNKNADYLNKLVEKRDCLDKKIRSQQKQIEMLHQTHQKEIRSSFASSHTSLMSWLHFANGLIPLAKDYLLDTWRLAKSLPKIRSDLVRLFVSVKPGFVNEDAASTNGVLTKIDDDFFNQLKSKLKNSDKAGEQYLDFTADEVYSLIKETRDSILGKKEILEQMKKVLVNLANKTDDEGRLLERAAKKISWEKIHQLVVKGQDYAYKKHLGNPELAPYIEAGFFEHQVGLSHLLHLMRVQKAALDLHQALTADLHDDKLIALLQKKLKETLVQTRYTSRVEGQEHQIDISSSTGRAQLMIEATKKNGYYRKEQIINLKKLGSEGLRKLLKSAVGSGKSDYYAAQLANAAKHRYDPPTPPEEKKLADGKYRLDLEEQMLQKQVKPIAARILPSALAAVSGPIMAKTEQEALRLEVLDICFERTENLDSVVLEALMSRLHEAQYKGVTVQMPGSALVSLFLSYEELLEELVTCSYEDKDQLIERKAVATQLVRILRLFLSSGDVVFDEEDIAFDATKKTIRACGKEEALPSYVAETTTKLYGILMKNGIFKEMILKNEKHNDEEIEAVVEKILNDVSIQKEIAAMVGYRGDDGQLMAFLRGKKGAKKPRLPEALENHFYLMKGLCSAVIKASLSGRAGENFDYPIETIAQRPFAVPCKNCEPLENSCFQSPEDTYCKTLRLLFMGGLSDEQLTLHIERLQKRFQVEKEEFYDEFLTETQAYQEMLLIATKMGFSPTDSALYAKQLLAINERGDELSEAGALNAKSFLQSIDEDFLTKAKRQPDLITLHFTNIIAPTIKIYPNSHVFTPQDYALLSKTIAMSGTPQHALVHGSGVTLVESSSDKTPEEMFKASVTAVKKLTLIEDPASEKSFYQATAKAVNERHVKALIDARAQLSHKTNKQVAEGLAEAFREARSQIDKIIYFDQEKQSLVYMNVADCRILPYDDAEHRASNSLERTFTFYDKARSVGTDILQPPQAHAVLLADPSITLTEQEQGAGRMRQRGVEGQKLEIWHSGLLEESESFELTGSPPYSKEIEARQDSYLNKLHRNQEIANQQRNQVAFENHMEAELNRAMRLKLLGMPLNLHGDAKVPTAQSSVDIDKTLKLYKKKYRSHLHKKQEYNPKATFGAQEEMTGQQALEEKRKQVKAKAKLYFSGQDLSEVVKRVDQHKADWEQLVKEQPKALPEKAFSSSLGSFMEVETTHEVETEEMMQQEVQQQVQQQTQIEQHLPKEIPSFIWKGHEKWPTDPERLNKPGYFSVSAAQKAFSRYFTHKVGGEVHLYPLRSVIKHAFGSKNSRCFSEELLISNSAARSLIKMRANVRPDDNKPLHHLLVVQQEGKWVGVIIDANDAEQLSKLIEEAKRDGKKMPLMGVMDVNNRAFYSECLNGVEPPEADLDRMAAQCKVMAGSRQFNHGEKEALKEMLNRVDNQVEKLAEVHACCETSDSPERGNYVMFDRLAKSNKKQKVATTK